MRLLSFKVDAELAEAIEHSAQANDRSVSAEIRQAIREYLTSREQQAAAA